MVVVGAQGGENSNEGGWRLVEVLFHRGQELMGVGHFCSHSKEPFISGKNRLPMQETQETRALSRGWEERPEEEMAAHSSIPAGKTPWMEELRGPQSIWLPRVEGN